jgi:hypothetical protein
MSKPTVESDYDRAKDRWAKGKKTTVDSSTIEKALARRHEGDFFLTEVKTGSTYFGTDKFRLDAVAFKKSWAHPRITGYEVKVSRSDFLRDEKFTSYLPYVHELYIATPAGLVKREELPQEIGLIWYDKEKDKLTVKKRPPPRQIEINAQMLLYIIYSRLDGDRYPFHSDKAAYYREWVEEKRSTRDLGHNVRNKMIDDIREQHDALHRAQQRLERMTETNNDTAMEYSALKECLVRHGMSPRERDPAAWLEAEFARAYPRELDGLQQQLNAAMETVQKMKGES